MRGQPRTKRLRRIARQVLAWEIANNIDKQQIELISRLLPGLLPVMLSNLAKAIASDVDQMSYEDLLKKEETARNQNLITPRRKKMSLEDDKLLDAVWEGLRKGQSEYRACHLKGIRPASEKGTATLARYRRLMAELTSIGQLVGVDVHRLYGLPQKNVK